MVWSRGCRGISRVAGGASLPKDPLHYESVPSRIHHMLIWVCVRSKANPRACYPLRSVKVRMQSGSKFYREIHVHSTNTYCRGVGVCV